ncbi:hypothetical protein ABPG75_003956 [Micractinium tetrahymenae]
MMKQARGGYSASAIAWEDARALNVDASGTVLSLLPGQYARAVLFDGRPADPGMANRRFLVQWRGRGTVDYTNVKVLSRSPNQDLIQLANITGPNSELTMSVVITSTEPADPLRQVSMLPERGGICASNPLLAVGGPSRCPRSDFLTFARHHAAIVFNPAFLDGLKRYKVTRFMDWQCTNNAPALAFRQRAAPHHQFWTSQTKGVPLEVMVALANVLRADPWFCIPHRADDAYVTTFAAVVRDQLGPSLRAHFEYSNEVGMATVTQTVIRDWHR